MKKPEGLFRWAILLAALSVVLYLCWQMLRPFVAIIAWSVVLVITFHPVQQRLVKYTRRPSLSALLSSLLVVLTILIPVLLITGLIVSEAFTLAETLHGKFQGGFDPKQIPPVRHIMEWLIQHAHWDPARVEESIRQHASQLVQGAAQSLLTVAGNVSSLVVSFVFTVFTMFYLFRDGVKIMSQIPDLLPLERSQSESVITRIRDVIDGSIYGVLVIAVIQGGLGGLIFGVLGIPSPVLWGLVMAVASLIPLLGAASVWVPGALYLLLTGQGSKALIVAAFGGLVISSVDNFLRPKLVGEKVRLSELVMFFSVLGGLEVFGMLGIVVGPVVYAVAGSLLDVLRHPETEAESAPAAVSTGAASPRSYLL